MIPRIGLFLSLFLTISVFHAQDTISVYFDFGISKIRDDQFEVLNNLRAKYDLTVVDSIHYIGMADSVGNFNANIRLSEKRAKNVAKYCEDLFPKYTPYSIYSKGEELGTRMEKNRRVDIIMFVQTGLIASQNSDTIIIADNIKQCYKVDYYILHRSSIHPITKLKKEYIVIETNELDWLKLNKHYYGTINDSGLFQLNEIKWKTKRLKKIWGNYAGYSATIPKESYDKYKIFTATNYPCDTCSNDFPFKELSVMEDSCVQVDRFLMRNLELKTQFFNRKTVKIRAPRELVDLNDKYYIGCGFANELEWKTQKGRKNKNYYFAQLPVSFNYIQNITRVMDCCINYHEFSQCDTKLYYGGFGWFHWGWCTPPSSNIQWGIEAGSYYYRNELLPYIGFAINKEDPKQRINFVLGTNSNLGLHAALSYQYHYFSFPFYVLNPVSQWQSTGEFRSVHKYARLYFGTSYWMQYYDKTTEVNHNVHLGIAAVNVYRHALFSRLFLQGGLNLNYNPTNKFDFYPFAQVGINLNF